MKTYEQVHKRSYYEFQCQTCPDAYQTIDEVDGSVNLSEAVDDANKMGWEVKLKKAGSELEYTVFCPACLHAR